MMKHAGNDSPLAGERGCRGIPVNLNATIPALVVLTMLLCSAPSSGLDWSAARTDSGELILRAPGLRDTPDQLHRATEDWNIFELGTWKGAEADRPTAQLILIRMKDIAPSNQHFIKTVPLSEFVRSWFPGEPLHLGRAERARNELGELDTQRFGRPGKVECMAVEQGISTYSDAIDFDSGAELLGDKIIRGWYCIPAGTLNPEQVLAAFVDGIGLKGFADPGRDGQIPFQLGGGGSLQSSEPNPLGSVFGTKSDKEICAGVRYGHPDYVAEAERRGWSRDQCGSVGNVNVPEVPPVSRTRADGVWKGRMACGGCSDCPGSLEKNVSIIIESGRFEFIPDTSYMGRGEIDADDTVRVWWDGYGTTRRKVFRFEGRLLDDKIELEGYRGPRSCRITLSRIER